MKKIFALLCLAAACAQAVDSTVSARTSELEEILTSELSDRLDAAIGSLDLLAVSAILDQVEKSHVHVQLLPRLKKLQAAWVRKRGMIVNTLLQVYAVSLAAAVLSFWWQLNNADAPVLGWHMIPFALGLAVASGTVTGAIVGEQLIATKMVGIAFLLCAKKNVCVVDEGEAPAVEAVLKALGLSAEQVKLYAMRML